MTTTRRVYRVIATIVVGLALIVLCGACAATRYVGDGEFLLSRVRIEMDSTATDEAPDLTELANYTGQRPNRRLFGLFNWSLGIYNLNNIRSNSWLNRRLRRWGDPPVIYSQEEAEYGKSSLTAALYNRGFLQATARYSLDTLRSKRISLVYHLSPGTHYRIAHTDMHLVDSTIYEHLVPSDTLALKSLFPTERYKPYIYAQGALAPGLMQRERRRITQILRNRGYWDFREELIHFDVDTLQGNQAAWVRTSIDSVHHPYKIGRVRLWHRAKSTDDLEAMDSTQLAGMEIFVSKHQHINPKVLAQRIWLRPNEWYRQQDEALTYSSLSDLSSIATVNILYHADTLSSTPLLHCDIITTPERSKEFAIDLVGTHSSGNLGADASLSFGHNNLLGGAEELRIKGRIGYENLGNATSDHLNYGLEGSLRFPRPFIWLGRSLSKLPVKSTTDYNLAYDHQRRPEFTRDLFSASWGYSWQHLTASAPRYALKLIEVDYMRFRYISPDFIGSLPTITRLLNYRDQFVVGSSIQMTYSTANHYRLSGSRWLHNTRLYLQSAGNALYGISTILNAQRDRYDAYSLLNINFAQFVKAEIDYSGRYRLQGKNSLAYHAALALVYPYGNSRILPIDLRYFSGGANSLRGWGVRSLGPGAMPKAAGTSIYQQVGDIKLDLSAELRTRVLPSWELALFADAGNVWTIYPYESQPLGHFSFDSFYKQIALSSGVGLRWDLDFFMLRLDLGLKLYDPQADMNKRWVIGWSKFTDLAALHFAIGYPF